MTIPRPPQPGKYKIKMFAAAAWSETMTAILSKLNDEISEWMAQTTISSIVEVKTDAYPSNTGQTFIITIIYS